MKRPFVRAWLWGALALGLEAVAAYVFFAGGGTRFDWVVFLALHAGASLTLALAMPAIAAFAFVFSLALPILGMLGMLLAVSSGMGRFKAPQHSTQVPLFVEKEAYHAAPDSRRFSAGGFRSRLLQRHLPATRRLPHLMTLGRRSSPFANRLLKDMLRDPSDEMRLAAYAILERREREAQATLPQATGRHLAQGHWEIAYQGLAEGEEVGRHLTQALAAAEAALKTSPSATDLWHLKGRILARLGDEDQALRAFTVAHETGTPALRTLPYQAEIAFRNRDFEAVRRHLRALNPQGLNPSMNKVLSFWTNQPARETT
jgi:tetratricopeptide (TPR) repeat protein